VQTRKAILENNGKLLDISRPVVMGILNATPDSFYNKGQHSDVDGLLRSAEKMLKDGASILDIGGASTKPGQELMNANDELERVMSVIWAIHSRFPEVWLSIDTYNSKVAAETVAAGVSIVNDVSSGRFDSDMLHVVAGLKVPYIAMHMQGTPKDMQHDPQYDDVAAEVRGYLQDVCDQCDDAGVSSVIIDPGFGFGKTVEHNFQLLRSLHSFRSLGKPILAGLSRKSMICKPLKVNPEHALNGTTALNMIALQQGANILRVHDVKEAMEVITLYQYLNED
jgi:dihydropteroate synthase